MSIGREDKTGERYGSTPGFFKASSSRFPSANPSNWVDEPGTLVLD